MAFGTTLGEHLTMAASTDMFYIAIDYKNKPNNKVAASNIRIKIHQLFSKFELLFVLALENTFSCCFIVNYIIIYMSALVEVSFQSQLKEQGFF